MKLKHDIKVGETVIKAGTVLNFSKEGTANHKGTILKKSLVPKAAIESENAYLTFTLSKGEFSKFKSDIFDNDYTLTYERQPIDIEGIVMLIVPQVDILKYYGEDWRANLSNLYPSINFI